MAGAKPKAYMIRDAMSQAVIGVAGPQQDAAEGPSGWKTTLLAYVIRNGPFALMAVFLGLGLFAVADAYVDTAEWVRESFNDDRQLSRAMAKSNQTLAQAVNNLEGATKENTGVSREILKEMRGFRSGVEHDHPEQIRLLRELTQRGK